DFLNFVSGGVDDPRLLIRDDEIVYANRHTGDGRISETGVHQLVGKDDGILQTHRAIAQVDQLGDRLFLHRLVDHIEGEAIRHNLEQQRAADSGVNDAGVLGDGAVAVLDGFVDAYLDPGMQRSFTATEDPVDFLQVGKDPTFTLGIDRFTGHVIQTQYHVLRRNDDRLAVGGRQ